MKQWSNRPFCLRLLCACLCLVVLAGLPFGTQATDKPHIQEPNWPLQVISWDIDKAYPGIAYEYRLGVQGGSYPYQFKLLKAPGGMDIHPVTGTITWMPEEEADDHPVVVSITDQAGQQLTHRFSLDANKDAFRFVAADGLDENDGSEGSPWATLHHAVKAATNGRYLYIKEGTHTMQLDIREGDCFKLMAYPGHTVKLVGGGEDIACVWLNGAGEYLLQGFDCDANGARWFMSVHAEAFSNLIVRKNRMRHIDDDSLENPAFLFFWDGPQTPILGEEHYKNILVQENAFHQLRSTTHHGGSAILYNVQDLVFEDNLIYDIDGNGITDKDDGFRNTYRNNLIYDCDRGIMLANQNTQGMVNLHHNLIYDCEIALAIGWQPGFLRDVFIHRNTLLGPLLFGRVLHENADCYNIHIYGNIIGYGQVMSYQFNPVEAGDRYVYPSYVLHPEDDTVRIHSNLIWHADGQALAGFEWGLVPMSLTDWQLAGFDTDSVLANPGLNARHALPEGSAYHGTYGRDNAWLAPPVQPGTD